jgi:hypothetical protein
MSTNKQDVKSIWFRRYENPSQNNIFTGDCKEVSIPLWGMTREEGLNLKEAIMAGDPRVSMVRVYVSNTQYI